MWSHRSCLVKAETSCSHQRKFDVVTSGSYLEFSAVSFAVGLRAYWRVTHLDLTQAPSRSRWSAQTKKSWNLNSQHPSTTPRKAPIKSFLQHLTTQFLLGKSQVLIAQVLLFATGMHKKIHNFLWLTSQISLVKSSKFCLWNLLKSPFCLVKNLQNSSDRSVFPGEIPPPQVPIGESTRFCWVKHR